MTSGFTSMYCMLPQVKGLNTETGAMLALPPDRIGHGTFLHPESGGTEKLVDAVRKSHIPIGIMTTAYVYTMVYTYFCNHLHVVF